jgi:hypothetical protein
MTLDHDAMLYSTSVGSRVSGVDGKNEQTPLAPCCTASQPETVRRVGAAYLA